MGPPRVCLVTQQLRTVRSGAGTYARQVLSGLLERGVPCTVALHAHEMPAGDIGPDGVARGGAFAGARFVPLSTLRGFDPTPGRFWALSKAFARAWRAGHRGLRDSALVHFLDAREANHFVTDAARPPCLGTVHDDYAATAARNPVRFFRQSGDPLRRWAYYSWLRRRERATFRRLDLLIASSRSVLETQQRVHGLVPEKGRVVSHGLEDPGPVDPIPLVGDPAVLFVGGNFHRRGLHVLVRACAALARFRPDVRLHVIGADRHASRIRALARRVGIVDRVHFLGHRSRPETLARIAGASCLAIPSLTEGFGLVFLEAMQLGIPAIGGDVGGTRELIQHGVNGLLVPPRDVGRLVSALYDVAMDHGIRSRLVAGGRDTVPRFGVPAMVARTLDAYATVLGIPGWPAGAPGDAVPQDVPVRVPSSASSRAPAAATENWRS